MKQIALVACLIAVLLSPIILPPQLSFAKNSLQDGLWDFNYVGIIVSDNQLRVGENMEIQVPVFNTGMESGSVLVSITLQDSSGSNYYGEKKIFDIPPNSKDNPSAKFYFIPEVSGQHSVNVVIHTPDAAHIFDSSPSGLFLNALEIGQTDDLPGVEITKLNSERAPVIENIPKEIAAEATYSTTTNEIVTNDDQSKIVQLENELESVKNELVNIKKDMNLKSGNNDLILFLIMVGLGMIVLYFVYKNRKSIKATLILLVEYYREPIPVK